MNQLTLTQAIIATVCIALVILFERAFPFLLFSKREPPRIISFIEKYIPPMVMATLTVYCLKDFSVESKVSCIPTIAGVLITAVTYKWKHNSLISIFGGTIIYMILCRIL